MGKIDELFDDIMYQAKTVANAAGKVTGVAVSYSKLKYQAKQAQWDLQKAYAKLGAFVYESKKSDEDFSDLINLAMVELDLVSDKINTIEKQMRSCKKQIKCTSCGKENEQENSFCIRCGSSLEEEKRATQHEEEMDAEQEEVDAAAAQSINEVIKEAEDLRNNSFTDI